MQLFRWDQPIPETLYHASTKRFDRFDPSCSHNCVWFMPSLEEAHEMAEGFFQARRGPGIYVYECRVTFTNAAMFLNEAEFMKIGLSIVGIFDRARVLKASANYLISHGFDGAVDCYGKAHAVPDDASYGCLDARNISIIRVHEGFAVS